MLKGRKRSREVDAGALDRRRGPCSTLRNVVDRPARCRQGRDGLNAAAFADLERRIIRDVRERDQEEQTCFLHRRAR
jgi:hypothetical protein